MEEENDYERRCGIVLILPIVEIHLSNSNWSFELS